MADKNSEPDKVSHSSSGRVPGTGDLGGTIHETTVEKGGDKYTGYGSSREEADRNAGEKYSRGEKDK
jgi:hypothetical protein